jgi:hypothetical protein
VEEESSYIQTEKLQIEQENRGMRDQNFELQSKSRAAETQAKRMTTEVADKDKQLRIMTGYFIMTIIVYVVLLIFMYYIYILLDFTESIGAKKNM